MQRAKVGAEGLGACLDFGAWILLLTKEYLGSVSDASFLDPYSCYNCWGHPGWKARILWLFCMQEALVDLFKREA